MLFLLVITVLIFTRRATQSDKEIMFFMAFVELFAELSLLAVKLSQ